MEQKKEKFGITKNNYYDQPYRKVIEKGQYSLTEFQKKIADAELGSIERKPAFGLKSIISRVIVPRIGEIVYTLDKKDLTLHPKRIVSGQYYGSMGLSNWWEYINLETGELEKDYGDFYSITVKEDGEYSRYKVNILGVDYEISRVKYSGDFHFEKESCISYCDFSKRRIVVCAMDSHPDWEDKPVNEPLVFAQCEEVEREAKRKEIIRAFIYESGFEASKYEHDGLWKSSEIVCWLNAQGQRIYNAWKESGCI